MDKIRNFFTGDIYAMETTGIEIEKAEDGFAVCSLTPGAGHANADGVVQGGALYTLADFCFAVAANAGSITATGQPNTVTLSANITYLRPARIGEKLIATARRVRSGRTTCYYEVNVAAESDTEKIIAAVTVSGVSPHRSTK